jgi:hypothetical protein
MYKAHYCVNLLKLFSSTPTLHLNEIFASGTKHKVAATVPEALGVKVEAIVVIGFVLHFQPRFPSTSHVKAVRASLLTPGSTTFVAAANLHFTSIAAEITPGFIQDVIFSVGHDDVGAVYCSV